MNTRSWLFILLLLLVSLSGCFVFQRNNASVSTQSKSNASDFSAMYNPSASVVNPQLVAYVSSESEADVFFRIQTRELRNALANPIENEINLYVRYFLRDASDFHIVDTTSLVYAFNVSQGEYVYGHFKVGINEKIRYKLVVDFANSHYNVRKRLLCDIKNTQDFNDGKYLLKNLSGEVLFTNVIKPGQDVLVVAGSQCAESIDVEFYELSKYVNLPPYLSSPVKTQNVPDSLFSYRFGDTLHLDASGFYALGSTAKNEKFGIVVTENASYPSITTVADMVDPMNLICTEREFARIDTSDNRKKSVDAFWLGLSGSEKNAKEQIRVFYNRVAMANMMFASRVEGWKTDRGMIYVMLGPPSVVNITPDSEEWSYGSGTQSIVFTFENYSGLKNDFSLLRSNTYSSIWQQVLNTWRSGKIFTVSKLNNE